MRDEMEFTAVVQVLDLFDIIRTHSFSLSNNRLWLAFRRYLKK